MIFLLLLFTFAFSQEFEEEEDFLQMNAQNPDVITTSSGLQYEILEEGEGERPTEDMNVLVHYEGRLLDGTIFDSTEGKSAATFSPKQVIPGWREGLQLMPKGSKFRFFIPHRLGYGSRSTGKIPSNSLLIFDVELLDVTEPVPLPWYQEIIQTPVVGPIKLFHVILFICYVGMKYYMRAGSRNGARCTARHILVKSEDKIKEIKKRLDSLSNATARDFGREAEEHSICNSKTNGGSLGTFSDGDMVGAFNKVCFDRNSPLNKVLGPVKTKFGWHLIFVENRTFPQQKKTQ